MGKTVKEKVALVAGRQDNTDKEIKRLEGIIAEDTVKICNQDKWINSRRKIAQYTGWFLFLGMAWYDVIANKYTWGHNPGYDWKQLSVMVFGILLVVLGGRKKAKK